MNNNTSNALAAICQTLQLSIEDKAREPIVSSLLQMSFVGITSIFASAINSLLLYVLAKKEVLKNSTSLILTSMVVSDFLVGALLQPLVVTHRARDLLNKESCILKNISSHVGMLCIGASFFNICMFAVDRCYATMKPFRYIECNLDLRYKVTILATWITLSLLCTLSFVEMIRKSLLHGIMAIIHVLSIFLTIVSYVVIYRAVLVQRSKDRCVIGSINQLDQTTQTSGTNGRKLFSLRRVHPVLTSIALASAKKDSPDQVGEVPAQNGDTIGRPNEASQRRREIVIAKQLKRSCAVVVICGAYIFCYLPLNIFNLITKVINVEERTQVVTFSWLNFLIFLNSSLNPVIYCIRLAPVRKEVQKILSRMVTCQTLHQEQ